MKLKLVGLLSDFTGDFGVLSFADGLSTTDVSALDGRRMATLISCTTEDDQDPLDQSVDWGGTGVLLSVSPEFTRLITVADQERIDAANVPVKEDAPKIAVVWTRDMLETTADEAGISGIREISDRLGIKGTSIRGLIDQILSGKVVVDDTQANQDVETKV